MSRVYLWLHRHVRRSRHCSLLVRLLLIINLLFPSVFLAQPVAASVAQQVSATFYRGINLGGGAVTIDGNNWVAGNNSTPNLTLTGESYCDQNSVLNPAASGSLATMLRCAYWALDDGLSATLTNVPNGDYEVYLYTWESDPTSQIFSVALEGQTRLSNHASGDAGYWFKHGPWQVSVSDGTLALQAFAISGNYAMFSGIEVYRLPEPTTGGFSFYRGINLGGSAVTINGNNWAAGNSNTPNLTLTGDAYCDQNSVLAPPASGSTATMLRCAYWAYDDGLSATLTNVPNGNYRVYLYTWESDPTSQIFSVDLEGQTRLSDHASGDAGYWFKHGPWEVTISDGTLALAASAISGNYAMFAGIEVYRYIAPTATPTNTATATPTNTPTSPPATATNTPTSPPATATNTPTSPPATATNTPTSPPATATNTPTSPPATATNTPTGPTATATPVGGTNLAPAGTGYRWAQNTTATSNSNRVAATGINDTNLTVDVALNGGNDDNTNAWEAAGVVWASAQSSLTRVEFTNGSYTTGQNGVFSANFRLQVSSDGTTWSDATGWSLSPAYAYDSSAAGGATYTFTGSASNLRGMRVVGQVHTAGANSWYASARELKAFGTATGPTDTPTATATATATSTPTVNTPPTISDIPNQVTVAGQAVTVGFTIGDTQTPPDSLTLSKASSNEVLLPNSGITFGGSGTNRTVSLAPAVGQTGSVTVTITVSDGSLNAADSFVLAVNPLVPPLGMAVVDAGITVNRAGVSDQPLRGMEAAPGFGASIGDPVELADGSWRDIFPALALGGRGLPLVVNLYYSTRHWHDGFVSPGLNAGWVVSYDRRLVDRGSGRIDLQRETGEIFSYQAAGSGSFTSPDGNDTILSYNSSTSEYTLTYRDGLKEYYSSNGLLDRAEDRFGNRTLISWNASSKVRTITNERTGQAIELAYIEGGISSGWKLREIRDAAGNGGAARVVSLGFNATNQLTSITDEAGKVHTFRYDGQGRVDQYTDPNLKAVTNTYASTPAYRVATQTLPSGTSASYIWMGNDLTVTFSGSGQSRAMTFAHDAPGGLNSGRVTSATHANSSSLAFGAGYNSSSWQPSQVIDPSTQQCATLSYNTRRDITGLTRKNATGAASCGTNTFGTTTLDRDITYGYTTGITDALGFITTFGYSSATGALERQTVQGQGGGSQLTGVQNNSYGQPEAVTLADGTLNRQSFDTRGYPDVTTYDQGGLNLTEDANYDWRGFLRRSVNLQGVAIDYDYYDNGWLKSVSQPGPQGGTIVTFYEYDNVGNLTKEIVDQGGLNATTSYRYEPVGTDGGYAPVEKTDAEGNAFTYKYNAFGQLREECITTLNRCTTYAYTPEGWLDTTTLQDGRVIENRDYYPSGQLKSVIDGRGVKTTFDQYDAAGRLTQLTRGAAAVGPNSAANAVYSYTYNTNDQVTRINGPNGFFITYDYTDPYNRLKSETDALGKSTNYGYHPTRNWLTETVAGSSAEAISTKYEYDRLGRRKQQVVDQAGQNLVTQYSYSGVGECGTSDTWNLQKTIDPKGQATITCYNPLALLRKTIDATTQSWSYTYNNLGCMSGMTPPSGAATSYGCDKLNRQTSLTRDGQVERWTYNADDTLRTFVDFAGRTTGYSYDTTGRLRQIDYPAGPDNAAFSHGYTYYANDLLETASDPNGTTSYNYDSLNLMATRSRDGRTVSYTNNANGWLTNMGYWGEGNVVYDYQFNGEVKTLNPWGSGAISYEYRSSHLLKTANRPGAAPDTNYDYDTAGRLKTLAHGAAGTIAYTNSDGTIARDKNGNIQAIRDTLAEAGQTRTTNYTYDALNRLDTAQLPIIAGMPGSNDNYDYDAPGNRTLMTRTVGSQTQTTTTPPDAKDRIATINGQTVPYDANGNLREVPGNGSTIRAATTPEGNESTGNAYYPALSSDGRYVAFRSDATDLVPGASGGNIYIRDQQTGAIVRTSVTANAYQMQFSADGRHLVLDGSVSYQVSVYDRDTDGDGIFDEPGATASIIVSKADDGTPGNNTSSHASISADGRHIAFDSYAGNLVAGDTSNGAHDIYAHDRDADGDGIFDEPGAVKTVRLLAELPKLGKSIVSGYVGGIGSSISGDGRYVAFGTVHPDLVPSGNPGYQTFVHDRDSDGNGIYDEEGGVSNTPISQVGGAFANGSVWDAMISADGRYVSFMSTATNLMAGGTGSYYQVYVRDRQTGTLTRASVASNGLASDRGVNGYALSSDGRYVAFVSASTNLASPNNSYYHIYINDRETGRTTRVSNAPDGTLANNYAYHPSISAGGCYVGFYSTSTNLVLDDARALNEVFIHTPASTTTYTYDTANRLIKSNSGCVNTTYRYDGRDNLLKEISQTSMVTTTTDIVVDDSGELARVIGEIRTTEPKTGPKERQSLLYAYGPEGFAAQKVTAAVQLSGGSVAAPGRTQQGNSDLTIWLAGLVAGLGGLWFLRQPRTNTGRMPRPTPTPVHLARPGQRRARWATRWLLPLIVLLLFGAGIVWFAPARAESYTPITQIDSQR